MNRNDIVCVGGHHYLVDRTVGTLDCIGALCFIRETGTVEVYTAGHSSFADLVVASTDETTGLPPMPDDYDLYIDPVNAGAASIVEMIHSGIDEFKMKAGMKEKRRSNQAHKMRSKSNGNRPKVDPGAKPQSIDCCPFCDKDGQVIQTAEPFVRVLRQEPLLVLGGRWNYYYCLACEARFTTTESDTISQAGLKKLEGPDAITRSSC